MISTLLLAATVHAATFTLTTTGGTEIGLPCAKLETEAGARVWYRADANVLSDGETLGLRLIPPSGSLCVASPVVVLTSRTGSGTTTCRPDQKCPGTWTIRIEKWPNDKPDETSTVVEASLEKNR